MTKHFYIISSCKLQKVFHYLLYTLNWRKSLIDKNKRVVLSVCVLCHISNKICATLEECILLGATRLLPVILQRVESYIFICHFWISMKNPLSNSPQVYLLCTLVKLSLQLVRLRVTYDSTLWCRPLGEGFKSKHYLCVVFFIWSFHYPREVSLVYIFQMCTTELDSMQRYWHYRSLIFLVPPRLPSRVG